MLFPPYARLACLNIFHNWHNSPVKNSFDLEQIATEIILGVLASQINPD